VSIEFIFRLIGMVALAVGGVYAGVWWATLGDSPIELTALVFSLVGGLIGLILTPYFTTRPAYYIRKRVNEMPAAVLVSGMIGLIVGLLIASLLAYPLSLLPPPFGQVFPFLGALGLSWLGISVFVMRQRDIFSLFRGRVYGRIASEGAGQQNEGRSVLLDTSVIIDGRIADIARTGFISGTILVPKFVLNELQHIADSPDTLKRNRGRRGLDVLNQLQKESAVPVQITDADVPSVREVDDKLVSLAKQLNCAVVTNDYNLNHVAQLQGVNVLNINELANAVKAVFLPGETLRVTVMQEGKEPGQGLAYLDDGTMVVVDDGRRHMNVTLNVVVTKIFQTTAGRMIFAKPENGTAAPERERTASRDR
jgi:uncharacterized protein YacL